MLGWWLNEPAAGPPAPEHLRTWQRFVSDNLEFRLGVAIGAVVARAWTEGAPDTLTLPSLAGWKETTALPWFGFWARELLRWGTHDPFVAFCLAQGLARTREAARVRRDEYDTWLAEEIDDATSEDHIDPQLFLRWQSSLPRPENAIAAPAPLAANLTGTTGARGRYTVMPVVQEGNVAWLDPAGFELATSAGNNLGLGASRNDYELTAGLDPKVSRLYRPA